MVLGCDLITDAPLSKMADLHRSRGALMTCLFSGPQASGLLNGPSSTNSNSNSNNSTADSALTDPRYLASLAGEELLVALDMSSMTGISTMNVSNMNMSTNTAINHNNNNHVMTTCDLIFCAPQADSFDETNSFLPIKMSTLFRYPKLRLRTDLLDPHCYLFSLGIFKVIEEIIMKFNANADAIDDGHDDDDDNKNLRVPASLFSLREDLIPKVLRKCQRFHSSTGISNGPSLTYAFIVDSGHFCLRANTLPALLESTRQLMKNGINLGVRVASSSEISSKSQIGTDSLFGEFSRLGERSSIKKSVVGAHCSIGNNVKVVNCIVMDGAIIEDGSKLEGCILGPKAVIREKCQLKDCDVAGGFELERDHVAKAETFGSNRELVDDLF